jgi:hypothetical protein
MRRSPAVGDDREKQKSQVYGPAWTRVAGGRATDQTAAEGGMNGEKLRK